MLMLLHYWISLRDLACQSAWAYLALSKENVAHPCSEGNITFQKFSDSSAFPCQNMLIMCLVTSGFIVRPNRDGGAGALLVVAALHEDLKGLL